MRSIAPHVKAAIVIALGLPAAALAAPTQRAARLPTESPCTFETPEPDGWNAPPPFELRLCVRGRFRDPAFNVPIYLAGLGLTMESKAASGLEIVQTHGEKAWSVLFRSKTRLNDVVFELGERRFAVDVAQLPRRNIGHTEVATGEVSLVRDNPDWVVLRSARLLPLDGADRSMLEVVLENRSALAAPLDHVLISADVDAGFRCETGSRLNPIQTIRINWPRVVERGDGSGSSAAAWTNLGRAEVEVQTRFRRASCSDYSHRFWMQFPIQDTLAPGKIVRLTYSIEEQHVDGDGGMGRELPRTLRAWGHLSASIGASVGIHPDAVGVETSPVIVKTAPPGTQ